MRSVELGSTSNTLALVSYFEYRVVAVHEKVMYFQYNCITSNCVSSTLFSRIKKKRFEVQLTSYTERRIPGPIVIPPQWFK